MKTEIPFRQKTPLAPIERFQDKWTRLSGSKTRPNKDLEPGFGSTKTEKAIVLASASTMRRQLLVQAGLNITIFRPEINERLVEQNALKANIALKEIALVLARQKALSAAKAHKDSLIIGADQILELNGKSLHKPRDLAEAREQLLALKGTTHHLHCAVALLKHKKVLFQHISTVDLTMRNFSIAELDQIMHREGEAILGCVGAYRLEGAGINLFETIKGDYFAVLGLELLPLLAALRQQQT